MLAFLTMLRENYGGAEGYLKKYAGLSDEDLYTIRSNFLSESSNL